MRFDPDQLAFLPVQAAHYPLLLDWLRAPHIRQWWGDPDQELAFIRDMVEGRDSTRPFLITLAATPVGFIQYWFVGHHQNDSWLIENPWLRELPSTSVGIDISIGRADLLGQGLGSAALAAFAAKLHGEGHRNIIIDPDPANARAVRAYAKAGFRAIPSLLGRTGDSLIMQFEQAAFVTQ